MYEIDWSDDAKADLRRVSVFARKPIFLFVERLRYEADVETRSRKPLKRPLPEIPEATWEGHVMGDYRVLYRINEGRTVRILRAIMKGTETLSEAIRRSNKT